MAFWESVRGKLLKAVVLKATKKVVLEASPSHAPFADIKSSRSGKHVTHLSLNRSITFTSHSHSFPVIAQTKRAEPHRGKGTQTVSVLSKYADLFGSQSRMWRRTARSHSSKKHTTTRPEPEYDTVTIEPPKKPAPKFQMTRKHTTSKSQPETKPTSSSSKSQPRTQPLSATSHPARKSYNSKSSSSKNHTTGKIQPNGKAATAKDQPIKKDATLNTQPTANYPTADGQPEGNLESFGTGIYLPCNGSRRPTTIALTKVGHDGVGSDDCIEMEKWLGSFLNLKPIDNKMTFSWEYRQLLGTSVKELGCSVDSVCLLYLCCDRKSKLPSNRYLEDLSEVCVYGDAFMFKVIDNSPADKLKFLHMGWDSVEDLEKGGDTKVLLKKVLSKLRRQKE